MTQYGFFFDQSRCYGCKACSVACKDWYDIAPGPEKWMSVYMWEKGRFPNPSIGILAFNCGHCDNPVCAAACDNGAIFKEEKYGAVLVDQDKCKGDRHCFEACPYGAPKFASDEPGTKMSKCTMCIDRLEKAGLVARSPDPEDRRGVLVRLTDLCYGYCSFRRDCLDALGRMLLDVGEHEAAREAFSEVVELGERTAARYAAMAPPRIARTWSLVLRVCPVRSVYPTADPSSLETGVASFSA